MVTIQMRWRQGRWKRSCHLKLSKRKTIIFKTISFLWWQDFFGNILQTEGALRTEGCTFSQCTSTCYIVWKQTLVVNFYASGHIHSPKIATVFQRVWINKLPLILNVFLYANHSKWAKGNTNQFKNSRYFSGVQVSNRCLWKPFIPVLDKHCDVKNLDVTQGEKSETGQDIKYSGLFINTKIKYIQCCPVRL